MIIHVTILVTAIVLVIVVFTSHPQQRVYNRERSTSPSLNIHTNWSVLVALYKDGLQEPIEDDPQQQQKQTNRFIQTTASTRKRLLVIRVTSLSSGETPNESIEAIQGAIFGYGPNPDNITIPDGTVVEQYAAISHQHLLYEPVTISTATIDNPTINLNGGVWDMYVQNITFANNSISDLSSNILQQAQDQLVSQMLLSSSTSTPSITSILDVADHIMFCLPSGSLFHNNSDWTAFSYIHQPYSYYQLSRCTKLSVVMHEIGHSLGFQHSGYDDSMYGDKTGYMGYASNQFGYPRKAFNGHKHWISGWFRHRTIMIDPSNGPTEVRLVSFVHYSDRDQMHDDDVVLIRFRNLYIQYNRAKMYNIDTDLPNTVTITHAVSNDDVSERYAALSEGEKFVYSIPDDSRVLVVQVCSLVQYETSQMDYAVLRFHYDNSEIDFSACSSKYVSKQPPLASQDNNTTIDDSTIDSSNDGIQQGPSDPVVEYDNDEMDINDSNDEVNNRFTNDELFVGIFILPTILAIIAGIFVLYWIRRHFPSETEIKNLPSQYKNDMHFTHDTKQFKSTIGTSKQQESDECGKNKYPEEEEIDDTAQEYDDDDDDYRLVYI